MYDIELITVRFSDVYGPMDRDTGSRNRHNEPYWIFTRLLQDLPVRYRGELDDIGCDYIYAPDVAAAVVLILLHEQKPELPTYNITYGEPSSLRALLEAVPEVMGKLARQIEGKDTVADITALPAAHHLRMEPYNLDSAPLKQEFGWKPMALPEACREYVRWLRENSGLLRKGWEEGNKRRG
jgi:nucleoside-diphosphate-sugar epimerase